MLPMTEKTLKVKKQVTDVKYLSVTKKSSSETLTSETVISLLNKRFFHFINYEGYFSFTTCVINGNQ